MNLDLLADIYGVHKAFMFGQSQRADYELSQFIDDVKVAEERHLNESTWSSLVTANKKCFALSFYPSYLVDDSVFDVMAFHFAVSSVVREMSTEWKGRGKLCIHSVVIPTAVCSRYDSDEIRQSSITNVNSFVNNASNNGVRYTASTADGAVCVSEMVATVRDLIRRCRMKATYLNDFIVIVLDRSQLSDEAVQTVMVFSCCDLSKLDDFKMNYFISFDFHISGVTASRSEPLSSVHCWLTFGRGQRLRWYPEYAVWIIPFLFLRSSTMTTHKVVEALYSEHYKTDGEWISMMKHSINIII